MKKYSEYKDTGLSWCSSIPSHWDCKKIDSLFRERKTKVSDKEYSPLSVTKQGVLPQLADVAKTDNGDNRKLVLSGDFVINSRSDRKGSSGVSALDGSVSVINIVLQPRSNILAKFIHYLLKSNNFVEEYYRNGRGIVADLWTTRYSEMRNIYIPIPPVGEQEKIVVYLDRKISKIDQLIDTKRKEIAVLEEYRQGVINKAVTRGLNPDVELKDSGIEWIGEIPSHWDYKRLRHFSSLQNGISESGDFFLSGTPFATYGDIYKNMVLPEILSGVASSSKAQQEMYSVKKGDIFFTRTSETLDDVGISCVCMKDIEKAVFSGFVIRVRPTKKIIYTGFAKYYFRSSFVREYFTSKMNIVIRVSLGQNILKSLPVLLPPMNEQIEIADELDKRVQKFTEAIEAINKQISLLEEYRTRLISDVVTGQIDVK